MLIQVTNRCKMQCPHCLQDSTPDGGNMEFKTFMNALKFGYSTCTYIYNISGGEPTENPELLRMCKVLNERSLYFILESNGMWIKDKEKTEIVEEIHSLPLCFGIQVYSNRTYYKEHQWLMNHITEFQKFNKVTVITSPIKNMQDLGRARDCEAAQKQIEKNRYYMSCLNPILLSRQVDSIQRWSVGLQQSFHTCKPLVDYKGDVHLSESWLCPPVGNVNTQDQETIWENIQRAEPCGNCAGCRRFLASEEPKIKEARKIIYGNN